MKDFRLSVSAHAVDCAVSTAAVLLDSIGTPVSSKVRDILQSSNHTELLDLSVDPSSYASPASFRFDYLAVELMSKFPYLSVNVDRKAVAMAKFHEAELSCASVNRKIQRYDQWGTFTPLTQAVIFSARAKIANALGPFDWSEAEGHFGFGPGATFTRPRLQGDAYYKFGHKPSVTRSSAELAYAAIKRIPPWFEHLCEVFGRGQGPLDSRRFIDECLEIVPGNRVVTVPKNAKTDRVIAIEPCMNVFIQRGIGRCIRSRLKRVGVNLRSQAVNQQLALEGSRSGALATIDLSAASDSISMGLVELLLPQDWLQAIKLTRSPRGVLPNGELVTYQKVSSMGNGFTFELESLLFWALLKAVMHHIGGKGRISIYGDDIISPIEACESLLQVLSECGFQPNSKKTFCSGPFRESCGKHYFRGCDVTPFYIRSRVNTVIRYIWMANSVKRWSSRCVPWGLHPVGKAAYDCIVRRIPKSVRRLSVPEGMGDFALIRDFDEAKPKFDKNSQNYLAKGIIPVAKSRQHQDVPFLLRQLYGMGESDNYDEMSSFDRKLLDLQQVMEGVVSSGGVPAGHRFQYSDIWTVQWPDLGPWLNTSD